MRCAGLPRRPAFTFAAVLTLALGIGATTAIFSVVYSVLIKPLPYPNADELVRIRHTAAAVSAQRSAVPSRRCTSRTGTRTGRSPSIGMWSEGGATLTDRGEPERVRALRVTDGTLQALGVQPMRGRWFTEAGARTRGRRPGAGHSLSCVLATAIRRRRSGARARALDRSYGEPSRKSSASCRPISDSST